MCIEILVSLDGLVYVARWFEDQFTYLNGESDNTVFPSNSNVPSLSLPLFLSVSLCISLSVSLLIFVSFSILPDGIPLDGTPIRILSTFHLSLVIITYIISFAGLVFGTVCLVFTFYFRNKK